MTFMPLICWSIIIDQKRRKRKNTTRIFYSITNWIFISVQFSIYRGLEYNANTSKHRNDYNLFCAGTFCLVRSFCFSLVFHFYLSFAVSSFRSSFEHSFFSSFGYCGTRTSLSTRRWQNTDWQILLSTL